MQVYFHEKEIYDILYIGEVVMKKFTTNILKDILFQEEKIDLHTPDCY